MTPGGADSISRSQSVCVVLPAYNAARTLAATVGRIPREGIDHVLLVDDGSIDGTAGIARRLGIQVIEHESNRGYGANQKTCYLAAMKTDASIVVMVHPDGQHDPELIPHIVGFVASGVVDIVLGNRILRRSDVLGGGMPPLKYFVNRILTIVENVILGYNLPEYHTGYRAFSRRVLETVNFEECSDDFIFDQEILVQARLRNFRVGSVPVPTHYGNESSSISLGRGFRYTVQTLLLLVRFILYRLGWHSQGLFLSRRLVDGSTLSQR